MAENIGRPDENSFGNQAFSANDNQGRIGVNAKNKTTDNQNNSDSWGNNQARKLAEQAAAQREARSAESAAVGQPNYSNDARTIEQNQNQTAGVNSLYSPDKSKNKNQKKKGLKKYGPLGAILGTMILVMVAFSGSIASFPVAFISNMLELNNPLRTTMNLRTTYALPDLLHGGLNSKITTKGLFGFGQDRFKISNSMSKNLAKNGIKYIETTGTDGKPLNLLVYDDGPNGKPMAVAAYQKDSSRIPDSLEIPSAEVDTSGNRTSTKIDLDIDNKMTFDDAMSKNSNFFKAEEKSTRTLKGHIAGWFDSLADKVDTMLGTGGRNRQGKLDKDASNEEIQRSADSDGMKEDVDESKGGVDVDSNETDDPDKISPTPVDDGPDALQPGMNAASAQNALASRAKKAAAAVGKASAITTVAGYACAVMKTINLISQTIGAMILAHVTNHATSIGEIFDKTKAGDGSNAANLVINGWNQRGPSRDVNGNIIPGRESSSAMMSDAINEPFSNGDLKVKANDPMAFKYNSQLVMQYSVYHSDKIQSNDLSGAAKSLGSIFASVSGSLNVYKGCIALQLTGGILSVFKDVLDIAAALFSGGASLVFSKVAEGLLKSAQAATIVMAIDSIIMFAIPTIAKTLIKKKFEHMPGQDSAYATNSGLRRNMQKQMQIGSGLPATPKTLTLQHEQDKKVIASEARFVRETKSPFDPSSPYTFFGSLVRTMIPIASSMSSPLATFSKISNVVGSTISKFTPTADAVELENIKTSLNKNCPSANAFDEPLAMDAYCNQYFTSDFSTIRMKFDEVFDRVGKENLDIDNIDENANNGNPEIKEGSELAKWTLSCAVRESPLGVADSGIESVLSRLTPVMDAVGAITNSVIGIIPVVGSLVQSVIEGRSLANVGWTTGEKCASEDSKYFSRYSEDQRFLESAGLIEKSAVTAYLDRYYEKNPLDFSDSGIVARYTGMSKEQAEIGLGLIEYNQFLAQYHPKEKGPEILPVVQEYQYEPTTVIAEVLPSSSVKEKVTLYRQRLSFAIA